MNDVWRGEFELSWNNRQEVLKLPVNQAIGFCIMPLRAAPVFQAN